MDDSGPNRGPELAAITIAFLALCYISVGLRCYSMGHLLKRFYPEDWVALVTLVFYTAYSVFILLAAHYGIGNHVDDVPRENRPTALMWKWAGEVAYVVVALAVKFTVGLLILRICAAARWQRVIIWTLLVVNGAYNCFYIFNVILQCRPVDYFWFRYDTSYGVTGSCNNKALATIPTYISFILGVISDWTLALLPVSVVRKANLDKRTKISVVCILAMGSIASLATICRIPYAGELLHNPDYLYNFTDLAIWSVVEVGLGLSAASLATLKPLFRKLKIIATSVGYESHLTGGRSRRGTGPLGTGASSRHRSGFQKSPRGFEFQEIQKTLAPTNRNTWTQKEMEMHASVTTTVSADREGSDEGPDFIDHDDEAHDGAQCSCRGLFAHTTVTRKVTYDPEAAQIDPWQPGRAL